jgi:hypothetical protein
VDFFFLEDCKNGGLIVSKLKRRRTAYKKAKATRSENELYLLRIGKLAWDKFVPGGNRTRNLAFTRQATLQANWVGKVYFSTLSRILYACVDFFYFLF